jgi:hypothetical protein
MEMGEADDAARILIGLSRVESATLSELTAFTGLSRPRLFAAARMLDRRGWLTFQQESTGKRGVKPFVFRRVVSPAKMRRHYLAHWSRQWTVIEKGMRGSRKPAARQRTRL